MNFSCRLVFPDVAQRKIALSTNFSLRLVFRFIKSVYWPGTLLEGSANTKRSVAGLHRYSTFA